MSGDTTPSAGAPPKEPHIPDEFVVEPTVFAAMRPEMRIATEEIFGPVLPVLKWREKAEMIQAVNAVDHGLTTSIWTDDLHTAMRMSRAVEAAYTRVNEVSKHFLGAPGGGYKQSGMRRE